MYKISVDFNNVDEDRCVSLGVHGALKDIKDQNIDLYDGLTVWLLAEDIMVKGTVKAPADPPRSAWRVGEWRAEFSEQEVIDAFSAKGR